MSVVYVDHRFKGHELHPGQRRLAELMESPGAREVLAVCGRRWGKTTCVEVLLRRMLRQRLDIGWYAHVRRAALLAYEATLAVSPQSAIGRKLVGDEIAFINGSRFRFGSMEDADNYRGRGHDVVVLDEGGLISTRARDEVVHPMLAESGVGLLVVFATPKGKRGPGSWLWRDFRKAQSGAPGYYWHRGPSFENPSENVRSYCEFSRENLPDRSYRQEILAEFLDDGAGCINLLPCLTLGGSEERPARMPWQGLRPVESCGHYVGGRTVWGLDLAKLHDYTWLWGLDETTGDCVYSDRFNLVAWEAQVDRVFAALSNFVRSQSACARHPRGLDCELWVDATGVGGPVVEMIQAKAFESDLVSVHPVTFTSDTKQTLVQGLQVATERREVAGPYLTEIAQESDAFQAEPLTSGRVRYSAASGFTDDGIMAWSLANMGRMRSARLVAA